ncbi:unnamed protein product [Cuscuta campestris]|uniref:F-box domain-containing protein n=1 Tax=Cuscuta campestris TaxID=132261 RepID=A0A484ME49_9ASTE|nr:unnamed protein product [Cuscuta campestris]
MVGEMDVAVRRRKHKRTKKHVHSFVLGKMSLAIWRRKHKRSTKQVGYGFGVKRWRGGKQISDLPDEMLIAILSSMLPWEAARTSVLSRRWRYLWYSTFDSLDFDPMDPAPEAATRKQKFLRFLKDQWRWRMIENFHTTFSLFELHAISDAKSLEEARRALLDKKLEVEDAKSRLEKHDDDDDDDDEEEHARKTMSRATQEAMIARKLAEVEKEEEEVRETRAQLKYNEKYTKRCKAKLEKVLRDSSVEQWIVVACSMGIMSLGALRSLADDRSMEFYFTIGGSVDREELGALPRICRNFFRIEDLEPNRLYHLKNGRVTTLSSEEAAEVGFRTFSRLGL